MTEPNMEWEEDFQEFFGNTTDPNKFTEFLSFREVKDFIRQSISQAETRAYEKGKAEERRRIAEEVKKLKFTRKVTTDRIVFHDLYQDEMATNGTVDAVLAIINPKK